jgi:hypothetical protein
MSRIPNTGKSKSLNKIFIGKPGLANGDTDPVSVYIFKEVFDKKK